MLEAGTFVRSRAGHDRGRIYAVIGFTDESVLLADGKIRTLDRPKRKNRKHVCVLKAGCESLVDDRTIRESLKAYEQTHARGNE